MRCSFGVATCREAEMMCSSVSKSDQFRDLMKAEELKSAKGTHMATSLYGQKIDRSEADLDIQRSMPTPR
jgi:hypothetical protein